MKFLTFTLLLFFAVLGYDNVQAQDCTAEGGTLVIEGTTDSEITVCTGDGNTDTIIGSLSGNTGSVGYVNTTAEGLIRGFRGSNNNFSFTNDAAGILYIYNFSRTGDIPGLASGGNINDLEGCISFSNPIIITIVRANTACDDGDPCTTNDMADESCNCTGTLIDSDGDGVCDTEDKCEGHDDNIDIDGNGIPDGCDIPEFNDGSDVVDCSASSIGILTLTKSCIIVQGAPCYDAQAQLNDGGSQTLVYIWNATNGSWGANVIAPCSARTPSDLPEGGTAATMTPAEYLDEVVFGGNVCSITQLGNLDCQVLGGDLTTSDGALEKTVCGASGNSEVFTTNLVNGVGSKTVYVVTTSSGDIISTSDSNSFNFAGTGAGTNLLYCVSYEGTLCGLDAGQSISNLDGCFALSNAITIRKQVTGSACGEVAPPSAGIPTMGEWLLMSLALIFLIFGTVAMKQYVFQGKTA